MMGAEFVTACDERLPMVDRNRRRIRVGDVLRFQRCSGPYGQTERGTVTVTDSHYPMAYIGGAPFHYDFGTGYLVGAHEHRDYEHGHQTWVEVVAE